MNRIKRSPFANWSLASGSPHFGCVVCRVNSELKTSIYDGKVSGEAESNGVLERRTTCQALDGSYLCQQD
ncbi:unnamed protein product [Hermetia illucens]|uniref:Uncharacterized protein n=1 Tax=Hermetia illucens TaxID=343691 RepID=A0A7R8UNU1_HERIL|nr:unnamed protein product [Hermetia illucens]